MTEAELREQVDKIPMRMPTALEVLKKEIDALGNFMRSNIDLNLSVTQMVELAEKHRAYSTTYQFLKELGYD